METTEAEAGARAKPHLFINRNFRLLWLGQSISVLGDFVFDTTLTIWIAVIIAHGQSWAPLAVSGVLIAAALPTFIIGPLAGVFADRWNKRLTMLRMDGLRALIIASLLLLPLFGQRLPAYVQVALIYLVVFATTTCAQFFNPSRFTLISEVVTEPERTRSSSLTQMSMNLATIIGPVLAAPLLITLGVYWALLLNAFSFVISFLCIWAIHVAETSQPQEKKISSTVWQEFGEGLQFYRQSRLMQTILLSVLIVVLGTGPINAIFVFFVTQNLQVPASLYGTLDTAIGAGALLGALLTALVASRLGSARIFWLGLLLVGGLLIILARLTSFPVALAVTFLIGVPLAGLNTVVGPLIMHITPQQLLGRVIAVLTPAQSLFNMLSVILAGVLASTLLSHFHTTVLGVPFSTYDTIFTGGGVLIVLGGFYAMINLRHLKLNEK
ncbi:MAG TPA: MFS transporter [Ktedonobacteraceae bacterium]|nr:MFS transporter [Ktedonobacteraceae bacterium]